MRVYAIGDFEGREVRARLVNYGTMTDEEMERLRDDAAAKVRALSPPPTSEPQPKVDAAFDIDALQRRCRAADWARMPKQARQLAVAKFITSTTSLAYGVSLSLECVLRGGNAMTDQHERTIDYMYGVINDAYVEMCGADIGESIAQV